MKVVIVCGALFAMISCATVPPVSIYNMSYRSAAFSLEPKSKSYRLGVVIATAGSDTIKTSNYRYMYGAFLKIAESLSYSKAEKDAPGAATKTAEHKTFSIEVFPDIEAAKKSSVDYIATLQFDTYGSQDLQVKSDTAKTTVTGPTSCFEITTKISARLNEADNYIFKSNGCPGISDPRILASKVFNILFTAMWPQDSTRTYVINLQGSSPDSWFSDLITHSAVDKALGFKTVETLKK